jgi:hypothetical protein
MLVVLIETWPSQARMVLMSTPARRRCVAAEHLNSFVEFDDKLTPQAFAVIAVNVVALDENGEPVDSVGESVVIKRRVANGLGGIYPFFGVLAGVTTGVVLECVWRNKEKGLRWQIQRKRPEFPSGMTAGLRTTMSSWVMSGR